MTGFEIRMKKKELRIERLKLEILEVENEIEIEKTIQQNTAARKERNSGKSS